MGAGERWNGSSILRILYEPVKPLQASIVFLLAYNPERVTFMTPLIQRGWKLQWYV